MLRASLPLQVVPPFPAKGSTRGEAVDSERVEEILYSFRPAHLVFILFEDEWVKTSFTSNPQLHSVLQGTGDASLKFVSKSTQPPKPPKATETALKHLTLI